MVFILLDILISYEQSTNHFNFLLFYATICYQTIFLYQCYQFNVYIDQHIMALKNRYLLLIAVIASLISIACSLKLHETDLQHEAVNLNNFRNAELNKHNYYRRMHHVPNLRLDTNLNNVAQTYAQTLASKDAFQHSQGPYGENLYYEWSQPPRPYVNGKATKSWYDQISLYDFNNPSFGMKTGHFTQVIWKNSRKVGFGQARSGSGKIYIVANYDPPGNYQGQFAQNVLRL